MEIYVQRWNYWKFFVNFLILFDESWPDNNMEYLESVSIWILDWNLSDFFVGKFQWSLLKVFNIRWVQIPELNTTKQFSFNFFYYWRLSFIVNASFMIYACTIIQIFAILLVQFNDSTTKKRLLNNAFLTENSRNTQTQEDKSSINPRTSFFIALPDLQQYLLCANIWIFIKIVDSKIPLKISSLSSPKIFFF